MKNIEIKNKFGIQVIAVSMAMALTVSGLSGCGKAETASASSEASSSSEELEKQLDKAIGKNNVDSDNESSLADPDAAPSKDEIVYVMADANGNTNKVIVSDWLKNTKASSMITDTSKLKDITNTKGNETYKIDSNGNITWNAGGKDIHYQGMASEKPPVDVKITYKLDGKEISPKNLAGKSGKVTIRFDYTNNAKKTVEINGKEEEIAVPFAMLSGVVLDNNKFSNIKVTNGKQIDEGKSNVIVGMAFPGLAGSIDLDGMKEKATDDDAKKQLEKINIPEYVEITANVKDFEIQQTMTMASSDVLSQFDMTSDSLDTSDINGNIDKLKNGMTDLEDGSNKLNNGASDLKDGTSELNAKSKDLDDGAKKLNDGASDLKKGASDLDSGVGQLQSGISTLDTGAGTLSSGANQLSSGTASLVSGANELNSGAGQLQGGINQLAVGIDANLGAGSKLYQSSEALQNYMSAFLSKYSEQKSGTDNSYTSYVIKQINNMSDASSSDATLQTLNTALMTAQDNVSIYSSEDTACDEKVQTAENELNDALNATTVSESKSESAIVVGNDEDAQAEDPAVSSTDDPTSASDNKDQAVSSGSENTSSTSDPDGTSSAAGNTAASDGTDTGTTDGTSSTDKGTDAASTDTAANTASGETDNVQDNTTAVITITKEIKPDSDLINSKVENLKSAMTEKATVHALLLSSQQEAAALAQTIAKAEYQTITGTGTADQAQLYNAGCTCLSAAGVSAEKLAAFAGTAAGQQAITLVGANYIVSNKGISDYSVASNILQQYASGVSGGILTAHDTLMSSENIPALQSGAAKLSAGTASAVSGANQLNSGAQQLACGASSLKSGADQLYTGSATLKNGTATLLNGTDTLLNGTNDMKDGTGKLVSGTGDLDEGAGKILDGANELTDGLFKFDDEGIKKLTDLFGDNVTSVVDRLKAVENAGDDYKTFTGAPADMDSSVKFIYKTDAIQVDSKN